MGKMFEFKKVKRVNIDDVVKIKSEIEKLKDNIKLVFDSRVAIKLISELTDISVEITNYHDIGEHIEDEQKILLEKYGL